MQWSWNAYTNDTDINIVFDVESYNETGVLNGVVASYIVNSKNVSNSFTVSNILPCIYVIRIKNVVGLNDENARYRFSMYYQTIT